MRDGATGESSNNNQDDWVRNLTRFRVEARIGLAVPRPSAIVKITGLAI